MTETNWRNWIVLFIMVMGVALEVMKRGGPLSPDLENTGSLTEPYSVRASTNHRARTQHDQAKARAARPDSQDRANRDLLAKFIAANAPGAATFDAGKKAAEKKKKEECDEKNPKMDPTTGKPIACKKKKEKKEEAVAVAPAPKMPELPKKESNDYATAYAGGQTAPAAAVAQKADDGFTTLEDWERRLLNTPDPAETKRFIDKYKQNLVTADVFYRITQEMLGDSREDMKRMGVMCAGQTPSNTSFDLLASLIRTESSGSPARRDAEDYVARYADITNVRILESLLRSPGANAYTTVLATQKVGDSAKRYLNLPSTQPATNGGAPTVTAQAQAQINAVKRNATYFQRFLGILQDLSRNVDVNVKSQAGTTLTNIQTLLASVQQQPPQNSTPAAPVASAN